MGTMKKPSIKDSINISYKLTTKMILMERVSVTVEQHLRGPIINDVTLI